MEDAPITINQFRACLAEAREHLSGRSQENPLQLLEDACKSHDAEFNKGIYELVLLLKDFAQVAKRAT